MPYRHFKHMLLILITHVKFCMQNNLTGVEIGVAIRLGGMEFADAITSKGQMPERNMLQGKGNAIPLQSPRLPMVLLMLCRQQIKG